MGDNQRNSHTEEYCAEKMNKIIALLIALLVAVAASSEISGDSNERVVPEESLVSEGLPHNYNFQPGHYKHAGGSMTVTGHHYLPTLALPKKVVKKHVSKIVKKHKKSVKKLKKAAKKGKKGAIKKMLKKHIKKLKRRVNKHFKRHFRRSRRSSRRGRRSIRQRGTKWECSWNHNPWFPCSPRPGDVVVPPYNGYWTKRHRKRSRKRRRL